MRTAKSKQARGEEEDEILICQKCHKQKGTRFANPQKERAKKLVWVCDECHKLHFGRAGVRLGVRGTAKRTMIG